MMDRQFEPIQPVKDELYSEWEMFVETNSLALKRDRNSAIMLLVHPDPGYRIAAIESFLCQWILDHPVLEKIFEISCTDPDKAARYTAAGSIHLFHSRSKLREDKLLLEDKLERVLAVPGQVPEILEDLGVYFSCKNAGPSSLELGLGRTSTSNC